MYNRWMNISWLSYLSILNLLALSDTDTTHILHTLWTTSHITTSLLQYNIGWEYVTSRPVNWCGVTLTTPTLVMHVRWLSSVVMMHWGGVFDMQIDTTKSEIVHRISVKHVRLSDLCNILTVVYYNCIESLCLTLDPYRRVQCYKLSGCQWHWRLHITIIYTHKLSHKHTHYEQQLTQHKHTQFMAFCESLWYQH